MKSISGQNTSKNFHVEAVVSGRSTLAKGTIKGYSPRRLGTIASDGSVEKPR